MARLDFVKGAANERERLPINRVVEEIEKQENYLFGDKIEAAEAGYWD